MVRVEREAGPHSLSCFFIPPPSRTDTHIHTHSLLLLHTTISGSDNPLPGRSFESLPLPPPPSSLPHSPTLSPLCLPPSALSLPLFPQSPLPPSLFLSSALLTCKHGRVPAAQNEAVRVCVRACVRAVRVQNDVRGLIWCDNWCDNSYKSTPCPYENTNKTISILCPREKTSVASSSSSRRGAPAALCLTSAAHECSHAQAPTPPTSYSGAGIEIRGPPPART